MLTVNYDRLGLRAGERLLDIGAGFGRHAFEAFRRGAVAIPCDLGFDELASCNATFAAMYLAGEAGSASTAGEAGSACSAGAVQGSALALPFAAGSFERAIASEVLEHVVDDLAALAELHRVLAPGGTLAVTVPSWLPETICWKLNSDYHWPAAAGGHVRIYSETVLRARLRQAGFTPTGSHRAHALHSPYWWLKCAVGLDKAEHRAVKRYHDLLVWDIVKRPRLTRAAEAALNPVLGKSLVVYATKEPARVAV